MFDAKFHILQKEFEKNNSSREDIKEKIRELVRNYPSSANQYIENHKINYDLKSIIEETLNENKKEKIEFKRNIYYYLSLVLEYKFYFFAAIIAVIISQSILLFEKYLFGHIIDNAQEFTSGVISQGEFVSYLFIVALIFISMILVLSLSKWFQFHYTFNLDENVVYNFKKKIYSHTIHLSHRFHSDHQTGKFLSRINRGVFATVAMSDILVFMLVPAVLNFILVVGVFFYFDIYTALSVVITIIVFVSYSLYYINKTQDAKLKSNKREDEENGFLSDIYTNIESVKYFGKEKSIIQKTLKLSEKTKKANLKFFYYFRNLFGMQELILGIGTFFVVVFPILRLIEGELSTGEIVFIYTAYGTLIPPIRRFVEGIKNFYDSMGDLQELINYSEIKQEVQDIENAKPIQIKKGEIEFENVEFKYDDKTILENISFKINPNEKIALVGHSGGGKSTIIKILYRLYDIEKGSIKIDGQDISKVQQESLRQELSIVPQEAILFDDTIYNNIAFSNPRATSKEIFNAIKFSQLDKLIEELPKKEKTIVGERGVKLSGGEKQRVSIARALLANKKVLVLDEATSALDSKTEHEIQKDLKKLMYGKTSIIIAHRLSTIMSADKIIVMNNGKISAIGTHNELIKTNKIYKNLWELQKGDYI